MKHALVLLSGGLDSSTCLLWALRETKTVSAVHFTYGKPTGVLRAPQLWGWRRNAVSPFTQSLSLAWAGPVSLVKEGHPGIGRLTPPFRPPTSLRGIWSSSPTQRPWPQRLARTHWWSGLTRWTTRATPTVGRPSLLPFGLPCAAEWPTRRSCAPPLLFKSKEEIVELARELCVPIEDTVSCYYGTQCGECDACQIRSEALDGSL